MPFTEQEMRKHVTLPVRLREMALTRVKVYSELFDEVVEALRAGQRRDDIAADVERCKLLLIRDLEEDADRRYNICVRERALLMLESRRDMMADEAVASVDSHILELAVNSSD